MRKSYKNKLFLYIIITLLCTSCVTNRTQIKSKTTMPSRIIIITGVDEKTTINGLYLSSNVFEYSFAPELDEDLSDDVKNFVNKENADIIDASSDKNIKEKNVKQYLNIKVDYYKDLIQTIRLGIEKSFFIEFAKNNISSELYRSLDELRVKEDIVIGVRIRDYEVGEFNLIRNNDTKIRYEVIVENYDKKIIAIFNKNYIVKTNPDYPLETMRLVVVNELFSKDFAKFMTKIIKKSKSTNGYQDKIRGK